MSRARIRVGGVITWGEADVTETAYGFMEPAYEPTITRRMATPAELAIIAARDTAPGYLGMGAPARSGRDVTPPKGFLQENEATQASRRRGAAATHAKRAPRPSRPGLPRNPKQSARVIARAAVVMEAMDRHHDDKAAVCRELGMRLNAVTMVVKYARMRVVA